MSGKNLLELERKIEYFFKNKSILEESLRHSSWVNENPEMNLRDNERLEFLGDAVINLVVADCLMKKYPGLHEGELSRIRANLVNETQLADLARGLQFGLYLMLGKGELLTNGLEKNSILADAMEAMVAAVYLDGGFNAAFGFVQKCLDPLLMDAISPELNQDFKSRLQEIVQTRLNEMPDYKIIRETGPDHDKTFHVQIEVFNIQAVGTGKSKKTAEQDAARILLEILKES
ncbi:MAG: ribonuclease III [Desulfobacterales bacterium]